MTYPERMMKIRIIAPKTRLSIVINTIYDLGLCHLTPLLKGKYELDIGRPLAEAEVIASLLLKIRSVMTRFSHIKAQKHLPSLSKKTLSAARRGIEKLHTDFLQYEEEEKHLSKKEELIKKVLQEQQMLQSFSVDFSLLQRSRALQYFLGTVKGNVPALLQEKFPQAHIQQQGELLLIISKREEATKIQPLLQEIGFMPLSISLLNVKTLEQMKTEQLKLREKKVTLQQRFQNMEKQLPVIKALEEQFEEEIRKQELPLSFAVTGKTFLAEGWIPRKDQKLIEEELLAKTKGTIHIECTEPEKKDYPPIKMRNKRLITPFEFLLRLYDLPMYKELDPTSLVFITFPLFFGFMLGDVGYGLVLLIIFYIIKKKMPVAKDVANILIFASLVSIFFGLIFGEYFGFETVSPETGKALCDNANICLKKTIHEAHGVKEMVYAFPHLFSRVESHVNILGYNILTVLAVGAVVGFIHLNLGFIIGFINEMTAHNFWHALMAKGSWMIMEAGIIILILSLVNILLPFMTLLGIGLTLLGIILLGKGEGVQGLVEIPGLISNTLSYMRLGAVGLASVGLAIVVNEKLGLPLLEKGGVFIILGILIMILGHAINILLGVIGPFLHAVRLHYVEFFSKFFHGGGEEYAPFAKKIKAKINE